MDHPAPTLSKEMSALVHSLGGGRPRLRRSRFEPKLTLVTLRLARCKEYPDGCRGCGYQVLAPLDINGKLDPEAWSVCRNACVVRRFWEEEADLHGHLVHRAGGRDGATWCFAYPLRPDEDDEGVNFQDHVFAPKEYVSLRYHQGEHTFRITDRLALSGMAAASGRHPALEMLV